MAVHEHDVATIEELEARLPVVRATRDAKDDAYEKARARLDLSDHRAELRPGEACPLLRLDRAPVL